jgi:hypothetical protein
VNHTGVSFRLGRTPPDESEAVKYFYPQKGSSRAATSFLWINAKVTPFGNGAKHQNIYLCFYLKRQRKKSKNLDFFG